jgi:2-polyprenyl-3-methyl-5-hydroxy-6-metoxy-1,4-benzoquinol methylase
MQPTMRRQTGVSLKPTVMSFAEFAVRCREESEFTPRHGGNYLEQSLVRFYHAFQICAEWVQPGSRVLSAGAGGAFVEKLLADLYGADVTVIDFPQAIKRHQQDHARHGLRGIGFDLAADWQLGGAEVFDVVLSLDVIEHLPIPPEKHLLDLRRYLVPGGHLVLSTPNAACLASRWRSVRGAPSERDPARALLPSSYANEGIHRREYVAREILAAMRQAGLVCHRTRYAYQGILRQVNLRRLAANLVHALCPPLRRIMLFVARRPA